MSKDSKPPRHFSLWCQLLLNYFYPFTSFSSIAAPCLKYLCFVSESLKQCAWTCWSASRIAVLTWHSSVRKGNTLRSIKIFAALLKSPYLHAPETYNSLNSSFLSFQYPHKTTKLISCAEKNWMTD